MSSDLIANLNEQQKAAVTLPEVSSLILAGAGSGKTSVLISRIAFLLEHRLLYSCWSYLLLPSQIKRHVK